MMAISTLEDEQIVWTDKSSDVKTGSTNFHTCLLCRLNLSVCEDDFLKTICPSRRTSRPNFDLNSPAGGLRRTNSRFASHGGMELAKMAMVCGKFAWKVGRREFTLVDQTVRRFGHPCRRFCSSSSVKTADVTIALAAYTNYMARFFGISNITFCLRSYLNKGSFF